MKKVIVMILLGTLASAISAENIQDEFLGVWLAEPFVIEQEDGLLVAPEAVYSLPYLGITRIDFIDSSFVIFSVMDKEYRAFYEIESLDFDNYNVYCSLKNGEEFLLKLVRASGGNWKYLYRIVSGSTLSGSVSENEDLVPEEELVQMEAETEEPEVINSLYTGIMTRK